MRRRVGNSAPSRSCSPHRPWSGRMSANRKWLVGYASALMDMEMEVFFNMFLGKPPGKSAPTYWHQDEAYWGRNLEDRGITCWIPMHDVDESNGCMHFIDRGHRDGIITH